MTGSGGTRVGAGGPENAEEGACVPCPAPTKTHHIHPAGEDAVACEVPYFITLTYPDEFPVYSEEFKRNLEAL